MDFTDGIKKIFLAGVGAVATTAEKSKEVVDDLVKKGELTVEQGKQLNEELKHKKETEQKAKKFSDAAVRGDFSEMLNHLSPEQLASLREQLDAVKDNVKDVVEDVVETVEDFFEDDKDKE